MTSRSALSLDLCVFGELRSFLRPIVGEPGSSAAEHAAKKDNTGKSKDSEGGRKGPKEQHASNCLMGHKNSNLASSGWHEPLA